MPAKTPHIPKYRHYKPKDLAVVRIDGRDHYLGKYDSRRATNDTAASSPSGSPLAARPESIKAP